MRIRYLFFLLLLFSTPTFAADNGYFSPTSLPPTLIVPPLPVHSDKWNAEVQQIIKMQGKLTDDDKKQITAEIHFGPEIFADALPNWDEKHYPATFHLLAKADRTCSDVTEQDKKYWHTRRPYIEEPKIQSFAGNIKNGSYPSGHAACSRVMAETLGQVVPDKVDNFRTKAWQVGLHRVMAGVHYPSDMRIGEQLAMIIMGALEQTPDFQKDMKAAQAEFAK